MQKKKKIKLAIFGIGMHFQETYSTAFKLDAVSDTAEIAWVLDLEEKKDIAIERCNIAGQDPLFVGVDKFDDIVLPKKISEKLDVILTKHPIDCVLVSTTPEQHRAYCDWAIGKGLSILLDKPLTSRHNAMNNQSQAQGIYEDWEYINDKAKQSNVFVLVNSHRRYHPGYVKVGRLLEEVANQTGCGVTMISTFNSDGQWRFPKELRDIQYHGYDNGNGVVSHFGYHPMDVAMYFYKKGTPAKHLAGAMDVTCRMLSAKEYVSLVPTAIANKALVSFGETATDDDDSSIRDELKNFGEVDAYVTAEMIHNEEMSCHISVQMVHSGFSQRAWAKPAVNLYKENGRVRWENHLIQQGPFQAIEIRSYQAVQPSWKHPDENIDRFAVGGADHFEVTVYRNKILKKPVLENINIRELLDTVPNDRVIHEDVKANVLLYFLVSVAKRLSHPILGEVSKDVMNFVDKLLSGDAYDLSTISTHQATTSLMSACYESNSILVNSSSTNTRVRKKLLW